MKLISKSWPSATAWLVLVLALACCTPVFDGDPRDVPRRDVRLLDGISLDSRLSDQADVDTLRTDMDLEFPDGDSAEAHPEVKPDSDWRDSLDSVDQLSDLPWKDGGVDAAESPDTADEIQGDLDEHQDLPEVPPDCDDHLSCTVDLLEGDECLHFVNADFCLIEGRCVPSGGWMGQCEDGAADCSGDADNCCLRCDTSFSQYQWRVIEEGTHCFGTEGPLCLDGLAHRGCETRICGCGQVCDFCYETWNAAFTPDFCCQSLCSGCCMGDDDCGPGAVCAAEHNWPCVEAGPDQACGAEFGGSCVPLPAEGSCWYDTDCDAEAFCEDAFPCLGAGPEFSCLECTPLPGACAPVNCACVHQDLVSERCLEVCSLCIISGEQWELGELNPESDCLVCDTAQSRTDWSRVQDLSPCAEGAGVCNSGTCCIPELVCWDRVCGPSGCPDGSVCGECPAGFECNEGRCRCVPSCLECGDDGCGGSCGSCDDGLDCTDDLCQDGICEHSVLPDTCLINDWCYSPGASVPDGEDDYYWDHSCCAYCDPSLSQTEFTLLSNGEECVEDFECTECWDGMGWTGCWDWGCGCGAWIEGCACDDHLDHDYPPDESCKWECPGCCDTNQDCPEGKYCNTWLNEYDYYYPCYGGGCYRGSCISAPGPGECYGFWDCVTGELCYGSTTCSNQYCTACTPELGRCGPDCGCLNSGQITPDCLARCDHCLIEGVAWPRWAASPDDPCSKCDPAENPLDWVPKQDWEDCGLGGYCVSHVCCEPEPLCGNRLCGPTGCPDGSQCGVCEPGEKCVNGHCTCNCDGRECGDDGCGDSCGSCDDGLICTEDTCLEGVCVFTLSPDSCLYHNVCLQAGEWRQPELDWTWWDRCCFYCDPEISQTELVTRPDGDICWMGDDPVLDLAVCWNGKATTGCFDYFCGCGTITGGCVWSGDFFSYPPIEACKHACPGCCNTHLDCQEGEICQWNANWPYIGIEYLEIRPPNHIIGGYGGACVPMVEAGQCFLSSTCPNGQKCIGSQLCEQESCADCKPLPGTCQPIIN